MKIFNGIEDFNGVSIPAHVLDIIQNCRQCTIVDSTDELVDLSVGGEGNLSYDVSYDVPGKGEVKEVVVHRVSNGIAANYIDPYMRRRDPDTMVVADELPSDKVRFKDKFGYEFDMLRGETSDWLKSQELVVMFFLAGTGGMGVNGMAIAPANAGFFAMGLSMLQQIIPSTTLESHFELGTVIYVAPPFRHSHFNGKQVVVHHRSENMHELFSYNLYPGPSAKKGLYSVLLDRGEQESWITAHCSSVMTVSPYDNTTVFMHEGASGGGKSEMHQHILKEEDGRVMIGENMLTGERRYLPITLFSQLHPVADDMAFCHPSIQKKNKKLRIADAENSWFIRVDGIKEYGDDPTLEKLTINPSRPLLFLNIKTNPGGTALPWNHIMDTPEKPCPNPRIVVPREIVPHIISKPVSVDIRSFGVRTPPSSRENPNYGIVGLFHLLPPAVAWLWRLVAPRGYANPSIIGTDKMSSEGVGSYWPFATGKRVQHANMLLEQILATPRTRYTLAPNQHIGVWKVKFMPQLLMREYLTRRGNAKLAPDQYQAARCPLLGYELNYLTIEGVKIPTRYLRPYKQEELGIDGYDAGAKMLNDFFKDELKKYLTPELSETGWKIIETCLNDGTVEDYDNLIPMR